MEAPPVISKFERPDQPSYIFNNPYMIHPFKRVRKIKSIIILELMDRNIDERMSVDINPFKGLEDSRVFDEFDQWFTSQIIVDCTIR